MNNQLSLSQENAVRNSIRTSLEREFSPTNRTYQLAVCLGIDPTIYLHGEGSVTCLFEKLTGNVSEAYPTPELFEWWKKNKSHNFPLSSFVDAVIDKAVADCLEETALLDSFAVLCEGNMNEDFASFTLPQSNFLFDETINCWSDDAIDDCIFNTSAELIDAVVEGDDDRLELLKNQVTCLRFLQQDVLCGEESEVACFMHAFNRMVWNDDVGCWSIDWSGTKGA